MKHHPGPRPKCRVCGWTDHQPTVDNGKPRTYAAHDPEDPDSRPICTACAGVSEPERVMTAGGQQR